MTFRIDFVKNAKVSFKVRISLLKFQALFVVIICLSFMQAPCARAEIPGGVHWGKTDFPPFTIISGRFEGQGVIDRMIDFYIDKLPAHRQATFKGSLQRVLTEMQKGKHVCHGSLLRKQDREAFAEFAEPNMIQFANGILTTRNNLEKFKPFLVNGTTIDFEKLVASGNITVRYHADRSYSEKVDSILKKYEPENLPTLMRKTGLKETDKEVTLMFNGRIDAVIGRPEEGLYVSRLTGFDAKEIVFFKVKGGKPFNYAQAACAKGAWNDAFFKDLDALSKQYRLSEEFMSFYMEWLPQNLKKAYPAMLKKAFHKK